MRLEDVLKLEIDKQVDAFKKGRLTPQPEIGKIKKQWDHTQHEIFNEADRSNKTVHYTYVEEVNGKEVERTGSRIEKVARIALSLQKLIVKRAVSFLFGNPVKTLSSKQDSKVAAVVDQILKDNKQVSLNRKVAKVMFSTTEVAEYWYPVEQKETFETYGFKTNLKLRCAVFSPLNGDTLYPFFDETGEMAAFSREYKVKKEGTEVLYFETWTADKFYRWEQKGSGWEVVPGSEKDLKLGKIPIVYGRQEEVEWHDSQYLIERLEKLLSNFADTNDYHGSPKITVRGEVKGFSKKGESGAILQLEGDGAEAKYLAWEQAPESVKLEIENLMRLIYSLTQTPDISFEAVKGMGSAASGESLKMLFLDPHLKVADHLEVFDDYLQRRLNILKAFVGVMNSAMTAEAKTLELTPEVTPFMVNDDANKINNLVTALSGKIISRKSAVALNPLITDTDTEIELLDAEREQDEASALALNEIQNDGGVE